MEPPRLQSIDPSGLQHILAGGSAICVGDIPTFSYFRPLSIQRILDGATDICTLASGDPALAVVVKWLDMRDRRATLQMVVFDPDRSRNMCEEIVPLIVDAYGLRCATVEDPLHLLQFEGPGWSEGYRPHREWPNGIKIWTWCDPSADRHRTPSTSCATLRPNGSDGVPAAIIPGASNRIAFASSKTLVAVPFGANDVALSYVSEMADGFSRFANWAVSADRYESSFRSADAQLAVFDRGSDTFIGWLTAYGADPISGCLCLAVSAWHGSIGSGRVMEIVPHVIDYLFDSQPVDWIQIESSDRSLATFSAVERFGFERWFSLPKSSYQNGSWHDQHVHGLSRENWQRWRAYPHRSTSESAAALSAAEVVDQLSKIADGRSLSDVPLDDSILILECAVIMEQALGRPLDDEFVASLRTLREAEEYIVQQLVSCKTV